MVMVMIMLMVLLANHLPISNIDDNDNRDNDEAVDEDDGM